MAELENLKNTFISYHNKGKENLEKYKNELTRAIAEKDERKIDFYQRRINDLMVKMKGYESYIEFMRPNNEEDINKRTEIRQNFPAIIRKVIPDSTPIVFHGNNNIGTVLEIIKTGGLFTPDQRGVSEQSFATQIDVSYKNNIIVSCEFADPSINSFMPYGAIFAFSPLNTEVEKVINTGESTEVFGGVDGVNFRENPERLIGIITTIENKDRIKEWCLTYGWESNKVFTHEEFILKCMEIYSNVENINEHHKSK